MFQHKVCNIDYDNALNKRLNERYFPSQELQPNFDPRPVSTKYTHFHTSDKPSKSFLRKYPTFNTHKVFYPGNAKGPVNYGLSQVDIESTLGNRYMALQKNDHAFYIPPLKSDLYANVLETNPSPSSAHFLNPPIVKNVDKCNLAPHTFHNSTRYNLKNLK